jgi:hypothetical protein
MSQWFRAGFLRSAQALLPELKPDFMRLRAKVGIRAQLYDRQDQMLVMDFLVLEGRASTHVLNVVSPGFTSGFSFADYVVKTALTIADD